jgi:flagellar biosynthesis/type III secretory pathway M-ring protein FliF/YscJ
MRYLPNVLLILSLPAALFGYTLGVFLVTTLAPSLANTVVVLFVALFVAGLCMVPFVIPFIDRKAKQDLAAYRSRQGASEDDDGSPRP